MAINTVSKEKQTRESLDLTGFSEEQRKELQSFLKKKMGTTVPTQKVIVKKKQKVEEPLSVASSSKEDAKKRVRGKRMSKVNGYEVLTTLLSNNQGIMISLLEDLSESRVIPVVDWKLAKKVAKALTRYLNVKNEFDELTKEHRIVKKYDASKSEE